MKSYPMICDVCGFRYESDQMRKRWDGVWVCEFDYEPRHPQDFVRGRKDRQKVPVVRNENIDLTDTTTLNGAVATGATTITVASATNISIYDAIGITLNDDNDTVQWTFANAAPSGNTITLFEAVNSPGAANGATVYYPGSAFPADISASDL